MRNEPILVCESIYQIEASNVPENKTKQARICNITGIDFFMIGFLIGNYSIPG